MQIACIESLHHLHVHIEEGIQKMPASIDYKSKEKRKRRWWDPRENTFFMLTSLMTSDDR